MPRPVGATAGTRARGRAAGARWSGAKRDWLWHGTWRAPPNTHAAQHELLAGGIVCARGEGAGAQEGWARRGALLRARTRRGVERGASLARVAGAACRASLLPSETAHWENEGAANAVAAVAASTDFMAD